MVFTGDDVEDFFDVDKEDKDDDDDDADGDTTAAAKRMIMIRLLVVVVVLLVVVLGVFGVLLIGLMREIANITFLSSTSRRQR